MGRNKTEELLLMSPDMIPTVASRIVTDFTNDGFTCVKRDIDSGVYINITKTSELNTYTYSLDVTLSPHGDSYVKFLADSSSLFDIFKLLFLLFVPVANLFIIYFLIMHVVGMSKQANLDNRALEVAKRTYIANSFESAINSLKSLKQYCIYCGAENDASASVCINCRKNLNGGGNESVTPAKPSISAQPQPQPQAQPQPQPAAPVSRTSRIYSNVPLSGLNKILIVSEVNAIDDNTIYATGHLKVPQIKKGDTITLSEHKHTIARVDAILIGNYQVESASGNQKLTLKLIV